MVRHLRYVPEPIPSFWKSEMTLGKITELEYYKHIYPRVIIKKIIKDLEEFKKKLQWENVFVKDIEPYIDKYKEMIK